MSYSFVSYWRINILSIVPSFPYMISLAKTLTPNTGERVDFGEKRIWVRCAKEIIQSCFGTPAIAQQIAMKCKPKDMPSAIYESQYYAKMIPCLEMTFDGFRYFKGENIF